MSEYTLQAPSITEIRIIKLAASYVQIEWDKIGSNFHYEVQMQGGAAETELGDWKRIDYTDNIYFFFTDDYIQPTTYYKFRVRAVYKGFEPGDWTESDIVLTSTVNSYAYTYQDSFTPSTPFLTNFFTNNDKSYINTDNDTMYATLMRPGYVFDDTMEWYTEAGSEFVTNNGFQVIYNEAPAVCKSTDRVIPAVIDDVIYAFERYQGICKVSNDGGENWHVYAALRGRAGNPVENCIAQQNSTNTFILGWDYMYQGLPTTDLTFDNNTERWSTIDYTFEKLDVENSFGFATERFTPLVSIPSSIRNEVESFNVDDRQLIIGAQDKVYEYNITTPAFDTDPQSDTYGDRTFETTEWRLTGTDDAVIKKIVFYSDPDIGTDLGTFYFLVPGVWVRDTNVGPTYGKKLDIDDTSSIRGVYKMNRTANLIANPEYDPTQPETVENPSTIVKSYTITGFERVYGNTDAEISRITKESTLSRDEKQLLVGVELTGWDTVVDNWLPAGADSGVRYFKQQIYTSYQKKRLQVLGTRTGSDWTPVLQDYYGSAQFNWMNRSGTRDYKDWQNQIIYIRPKTTFTVPFSTLQSYKWTYTFDEGTHTFSFPGLTIRDFSGYTDGALIHNQVGRMIGYVKFNYRTNSPASIIWIPERQVLVATLSDYTPTVIPPAEETPDYKIDPTMEPLLTKMAPEAYLIDDGLYKQFATYYMRFISQGSGTAYNDLFNLINSKNARDTHSVEYLYSEFYKRNRILSSDTREMLTRFFSARKDDFYSTKGIVNAYKFLFKLLYNADVELEVESLNTFEYYITITSNDMTDDMVGRRIYTTTASADITYYERVYVDGVKYWKLTLNNLIGTFVKGQVIHSTWDASFSALVSTGVQGSAINYNSAQFKERSKSYYIMKLRSDLQAYQYKDDIIRFVHPIGFGFLGITLLTVLINQGLSIDHLETIVNMYGALRFDMGGGVYYPDRIPLLDENLELQFDANGDLITQTNPLAGLIPTDETSYNNFWNNELLYGTTPYERRGQYTPTFDASWVRWSNLVSRLSEKLKDNIGNFYDPATPTQVKLGE